MELRPLGISHLELRTTWNRPLGTLNKLELQLGILSQLELLQRDVESLEIPLYLEFLDNASYRCGECKIRKKISQNLSEVVQNGPKSTKWPKISKSFKRIKNLGLERAKRVDSLVSKRVKRVESPVPKHAKPVDTKLVQKRVKHVEST